MKILIVGMLIAVCAGQELWAMSDQPDATPAVRSIPPCPEGTDPVREVAYQGIRGVLGVLSGESGSTDHRRCW